MIVKFYSAKVLSKWASVWGPQIPEYLNLDHSSWFLINHLSLVHAKNARNRVTQEQLWFRLIVLGVVNAYGIWWAIRFWLGFFQTRWNEPKIQNESRKYDGHYEVSQSQLSVNGSVWYSKIFSKFISGIRSRKSLRLFIKRANYFSFVLSQSGARARLHDVWEELNLICHFSIFVTKRFSRGTWTIRFSTNNWS